MRFSGKHLFVNAAAAGGELRAEILDERGEVIAPFSREKGAPLTTDATKIAVRWEGAEDLGVVAGKPVKFRFTLRNAKLFAFWVSPAASGISRGYVAAGGPGFSKSVDAG